MSEYDKAFTINTLKGPRGLLGRISGESVNEELMDVAEEVKDMIFSAIMVNAPVDSGKLQDSIDVVLEKRSDGRYTIRASVDARKPGYDDFNYALAVEHGTGRFGPEQQDIEYDQPVIFTWTKPGKARPASEPIRYGRNVRMTIRGQRPQRFMRRGWRLAMVHARRRFASVLGNI